MDDVFLKARTKAEDLIAVFARIPVPEDLQEHVVIKEDSV